MPIINPGLPPTNGIGLLEDSELITIADLQPNQSYLFLSQINKALINRLIVSNALRLRLYTNAILRDDDLPRLPTEQPIKGRGLILELISTDTLIDFYLSPVVWAIPSTGQQIAGVVTSRSPEPINASVLIQFLR